MTIEDHLAELEAAADAVRSIGDADPEDSHGREDDLMKRALKLIAINAMDGNAADAQRLALAGLATETLDFRRWYA